MDMNYQLKPRPYRMINRIQHYEWGTRGTNAFIPKFLGIPAEKGKPYAELWMGAHPSASSRIDMGGKEIDLFYVIDQYPFETLGKTGASKFANRLPFLLKILSAGEALSIQAHPNLAQAKELYLKDPDHYPDDNHKPELAIAITDFQALVGFRSLDEIKSTLERNPEIAELIGEFHWTKDDDDVLVKRLYKTLIDHAEHNKSGLARTIDALTERLKKKPLTRSSAEKVFMELQEKYPYDMGLLVLFFLNMINLKPGEGVYLSSGVPHAYLKGEIIECMANSDNVVRLGLTPKFKDIDTLISILDYRPGRSPLLGNMFTDTCRTYDPPVEEFQILICTPEKEIPKKVESPGPEVGLVMDGRLEIRWLEHGKEQYAMFNKGESFFIPAFLSRYTITGNPAAQWIRTYIPQ